MVRNLVCWTRRFKLKNVFQIDRTANIHVETNSILSQVEGGTSGNIKSGIDLNLINSSSYNMHLFCMQTVWPLKSIDCNIIMSFRLTELQTPILKPLNTGSSVEGDTSDNIKIGIDLNLIGSISWYMHLFCMQTVQP